MEKSITNILIVLACLSAVLHIIFDYKKIIRLTYLFKPLTVILIITIALFQEPHISQFYKAMVLVGLLFSLIGDIFLMLESDNFIRGLLAFLFAHIIYFFAIVGDSGFQWNLIILFPLLILIIIFLKVVLADAGNKKIYLIIYSGVIIILLWQAISRALLYTNAYTILAAVGLFMFTISDSILAYNKFVKNFYTAQVFIMLTYYTAQLFIALSI